MTMITHNTVWSIASLFTLMWSTLYFSCEHMKNVFSKIKCVHCINWIFKCSKNSLTKCNQSTVKTLSWTQRALITNNLVSDSTHFIYPEIVVQKLNFPKSLSQDPSKPWFIAIWNFILSNFTENIPISTLLAKVDFWCMVILCIGCNSVWLMGVKVSHLWCQCFESEHLYCTA